MQARYLSALFTALALLALPPAAMGQAKGKGTPNPTTVIPVSMSKGPVNAETLIARYKEMAGSEENASSLVNGLRRGAEITLTATVTGTCTESCTPVKVRMGICQMGQTEHSVPCNQYQHETFPVPTGQMGWGNVQLALAFTAAQLAELGIKTGTPAQMRAALLGGSLQHNGLSHQAPGILTLRASGMGWPQIAKQLGYTLQ